MSAQILEKYSPDPVNLLMILHDIQNDSEQNSLTHKDMRDVAEYLNISQSWVYGVATYYSMFSVTQRGANVIRVCDSPVCNMEGSLSVLTSLKRLLGVGVGETTEDGLFTIEHTECLGRCASAPSMMINEKIYGGVNDEKLRSIIDTYKRT